MNQHSPKGVSVVICCYNSSKRLHNTLKALSEQETYPSLLWEIILVDNASTDNTAIIAIEIWNSLNGPVTLRVVEESNPGLINARKAGIKESVYSAILFCDDDNWLAPDYVQGIYKILESDPDIAACGGMGIPVFEGEEPKWFYKYAEAFALGSQELNKENGKLLNLYGAGMVIQKEAMIALNRNNHKSLLLGRTGNQLSSAEDTELTYSFVLMGYKLACSNDLKFFHYLPKERLSFEYLNKLFIAFGTDGPIRNLYYSYISERLSHKLIQVWVFHLLLSIFRLIKYFIFPPKRYGRKIYLNWSKAYIRQLLSMWARYPEIKKHIESIKGRRIEYKKEAVKSNQNGNILRTGR